jgi:two-component system, NtrC family, nitrogen regulation sensor histidine kinase NtrY
MKLSIRSILLFGSVLLLPIVLILNFFVYQKSQEETYIQAIEKRIHAVEVAFNLDFELFQRLGTGQDSLSFERVSSEAYSYPFFIVNPQKELQYWSTNDFNLDFSNLDLAREFQVQESPSGTFLLKLQKVSPKEGAGFFVQAFRLVWSGDIKNEYVVMGPNPEVFGNSLFTLYPNATEGAFQVKSSSGQPLFGIDFQVGFVSVGKTWTTPLLIFSFSIFLLYAFLSFIFLRKKWRKGQVWQAIGYGFFILVVIRVGMLVFRFPQDYLDLLLFDPKAYSSSWLVPSLGDLLLHTGCSVLILGLLVYQLSPQSILEKFASWRLRVREEGLLLLAFAISTLFFCGLWAIVRDLVLRASWSLDITSIPSFDAKVGSSFLIVFLWAAAYVFLSFTLLNLFIRGGSSKRLVYRTLLVMTGVCTLIFFLWNSWFGVAGLVHFLFLFSIIRFDLVANVYRLGLETFLTLFYASLIAATIVATSSYQSSLGSKTIYLFRIDWQTPCSRKIR